MFLILFHGKHYWLHPIIKQRIGLHKIHDIQLDRPARRILYREEEPLRVTL